MRGCDVTTSSSLRISTSSLDARLLARSRQSSASFAEPSRVRFRALPSFSPRGVEMPLLSSRVRAVPRGVVAVPDPGEHQSVWRRRRRGRRPLPRRAQREQHVRRRPRRRLAHRRRHQHAHEFPQKPIRDEFDHQHPFRRLVPATRGVRLRSLGRRLRAASPSPRAFRLRPASSSPPTRGTVLSNARATLNAHLESFPGGVSLAKAQQSTDDSSSTRRGASLTFAASTVARGSIFAHQLSRGDDVDVASPRRAERGVERGVDSSRTRGDAQDPRSTRGRVRDPYAKTRPHRRRRGRTKRHALRGAVHALIRSSRGLNRSG